MAWINILMITIFWVLICDFTDIEWTIKKLFAHIFSVKPDNIKIGLCDLCLSWWSSLLYIIIADELTLFNLLLAIIFATNVDIIKDAVITIKDTIKNILKKLTYEN